MCGIFCSAVCVSPVHLPRNPYTGSLPLSISLIAIFPQIFLDEFLWRMHLICTLRCADVRDTRTTKVFFLSWLSNVHPAIHDVNQQKQEVNSSLPVYLHLLSLLCCRSTWTGPSSWLKWVRLVCARRSVVVSFFSTIRNIKCISVSHLINPPDPVRYTLWRCSW